MATPMVENCHNLTLKLCEIIYKEFIQINEKKVNNLMGKKQAKDTKRQVTEKQIQIVNTHMKRYPTLFIIKKMQSKPSMSKYFFTY